jgi:beta-carotene 3-hydroxylase
MSGWLLPILIVVATVAGMELVATLVHRHVMHGWGWGWHRSHHEPRDGWFERNDLYALGFAAISILCLGPLVWLWDGFWWVGIGMIAYGILYALLHDGLVHRRFPAGGVPRSGYLKRLMQAHRLHHAVHGRERCVSFGFLYAPPVEKLRHRLRETGGLP